MSLNGTSGNNLIFDENNKLRIVSPEVTTAAENVITSGTQYKELLHNFVNNNNEIIGNISKLTTGVEDYKSELTGLQFVLANVKSRNNRSKELDQTMLLANTIDYERALDEKDTAVECSRYAKNVKGGLIEVFGIL